MRPAWNGHISFGLISIPVSLYAAVDASQHVSFRMLHRKDKAPIHYKKFCSKEDVEVPNDEIIKGYEVEAKQYAAVEKDDLEHVESEIGGERDEMEVLQFVEAGSLNPLSFQNPYFVAPRKGGEKAYAVLREALNEAGRIGIVRLQMRSRPALAGLVPGPRVIALQTLRPFEELHDPSSLRVPAKSGRPAEVKMARLLIDQLSGEPFDPAAHPNAYRKTLRKLLAGRSRFSLQDREAAGDNVVDLMEALRQSIDRTRSRSKREPARRRGAA
jgi:DNA end-binding protein Ku